VHAALQNQVDFSHGYLMVLKVLSQKGSMTQHAIAQELFHSDAAVSRQVTLLLEAEYVTTKVDPDNRRSVMVSLTAKGRQVLTVIEATVAGYLSELLSEISTEQLLEIIQHNQELQQAIIVKQREEPYES
jgi:DNA-binding MarR family transcriptional regulator